MRLLMACVTAAVVASGAVAHSQDPGPRSAVERAVREFVRALAMHDRPTFDAMVVPHPRAERLLNRQPLTAEERIEAERRLGSLDVHLQDDFHLRGAQVPPDDEGDYPVGTVGHAIASGQGGPMVVTVVRLEAGWKIDPRWWIAMLDLADAAGPPPEGSPEHAVKFFLLALISLEREEALRFAVPDADASVLFAGAPRQREPSGVLEASAVEMPLVEVGPGELYRMPSGRVLEGVAASDRKLLVGQFGPVEMPFALRRVDNAWRVETEPYFLLINR